MLHFLVIRVKKLSNTNLLALRYIKREKASLPVGVRRSKTSLLKLAEHSLRAVSGNSRDGACFKLDKQTSCRKSNGTQKTICQNLVIKIL